MITADKAIEILLKEYDALRSDLNTRAAGTYQLIAISAVGLSLIVGSWRDSNQQTLFFVVLVLCAFTVLITWFRLNRDVENAAARLREIENHVNELAGVSLLCYENRLERKRQNIRQSSDPTGSAVLPETRWNLIIEPQSRGNDLAQ